MRSRLARLARIVRLCGRPSSWARIPRADVVVVFPIGTDSLRDAYPEISFAVVDPRESAIHAPTALRCLLHGRPGAVDYLDAMLARIRPSTVITFVDNFEPFMWLKDRHPEMTFVTVQNGVRGVSGDLLGDLGRDARAVERQRRVDHAFVFGPAIAERLAPHLRATYHPVGSFRSNAVPVRRSNEGLLGFVSTRRSAVDPAQRVAIHDHDRAVYQREVYAAYDRVAAWLHRYARRHGRRLLVIGKDEDAEADRRHYTALLGASDFEYSARERWDSSYRAVDRCEAVVFTSSSLGYEALARGVRGAAFLTWTQVTGSTSDRFGWPLELPEDGPFWIHRHDEVRFDEILDWIRGASETEWTSTARPILDRLVTHDPDNRTLRDVVARSANR